MAKTNKNNKNISNMEKMIYLECNSIIITPSRVTIYLTNLVGSIVSFTYTSN